MSDRGGGGVVLVAHGSPDPRHGQTMVRTAARLAERCGSDVHVAYLEHEPPSATEVAPELDGPVAVVPMLITPAYHARVDIPEAAEQLGSHGATVRLQPPLGGHPGLVEAVAERLEAAGHDPGDGVVLVAGGNSDGSALQALRDLLAAHAPDGWRGCALTELDEQPPDRPVMAFTLAEGVLHDRVGEWAAGHGAPFVRGGLADTEAALAVVLERVSG